MDNSKEKDIYEIDLLRLVGVVLKKWWLVALIGVLFAAMAMAYTVMCITPMYQASVLMYVNNKSISIGSTTVNYTTSELSAAKTLVDTYCTILTTRLTLEEVIKEGNLPCSYGELRGMITWGAVNDTEIFQITVTNSDPEQACHIANTIAKVLPGAIGQIVDGASVRTVDLAVVPGGPSSPNSFRNSLIGLLIGCVIAAGLIALSDIVRDTINSEDWLLETYGSKYPLLSVIPDERESSHGKYYSRYGRYGKYKKYGYGYYRKPDKKDEEKKLSEEAGNV